MLSRLTLKSTRAAKSWVANAYRVHQRLMMGCAGDPRMLFRIEEMTEVGAIEGLQRILVQSQRVPEWDAVFADLGVVDLPIETREYQVAPDRGAVYRFRLLANPTVTRVRPGEKRGVRLGLLQEVDQRAWLRRKLEESGLVPADVAVKDLGLRRSQKSDGSSQTHQAVLYDGHGTCTEAGALMQAVTAGIGPAKGYGFGLLSIARLV